MRRNIHFISGPHLGLISGLSSFQNASTSFFLFLFTFVFIVFSRPNRATTAKPLQTSKKYILCCLLPYQLFPTPKTFSDTVVYPSEPGILFPISGNMSGCLNNPWSRCICFVQRLKTAPCRETCRCQLWSYKGLLAPSCLQLMHIFPFICWLYLPVHSGCSGKPDIRLAGTEDTPVCNIKAR